MEIVACTCHRQVGWLNGLLGTLLGIVKKSEKNKSRKINLEEKYPEKEKSGERKIRKKLI